MPFVSEAQRRWMHANRPAMAKRWEAHTPKGKLLPKRKRKVRNVLGKPVRNSFCPTGEGGGVDPTCSPEGTFAGEHVKRGEDFGYFYHGGREKIKEVDPERLQERDYGFYGAGFYVAETKEGAKMYGRSVSRFKLRSDAKVLVSSLRPEDAPPSLLSALKDHFERVTLPKAEARGKGDLAKEEFQHVLKSPISFKDAVVEYGSYHKFDVIKHSANEVVVRNPKAIVANTSSLPGAGRVGAKRSPSKRDPSRTITLRRALGRAVRNHYGLAKLRVVDAVLRGHVLNAFCPTGEGGGIDPSCSPTGFHGTESDFTEFDPGANRLSPRGSSGAMGVFFAVSKEEARHYGKRIIEAKLHLTNPAVISDEQYREATNSRADARALRDRLVATGHDGAWVPHLREYIVFDVSKIKVVNAGSVQLAAEKGYHDLGVKPPNVDRFLLSAYAKGLARGYQDVRSKRGEPWTVKEREQFVRDRLRKLRSIAVNVFCPTGEGGGVDPTCPPSGGSTVEWQGVKVEVTDTSTLKTGKPVSVVGYRGVSEASLAGGRGLSALGHGKYYGLTPQVAEKFARADTIADVDLRLKNPLVIGSDDDLKSARASAGIKAEVGIMFPEEASRFTSWAKSKGYDSLVTTYGGAPGGKQVVVFNSLTTNAVPTIKDYARDLHERLEDVTKRSARDMARVLKEGFAADASSKQIARELVKRLDMEEWEAKRLARTELSRFQAEGQLDALEELGEEEVEANVEWETADDPCPLCEPLDGVVMDIDTARGLIPRHPNCYCSWSVVREAVDKRELKRAARASRREGWEGDDWGITGNMLRLDGLLNERFRSYFADCPRDDKGRCLPGGSASEGFATSEEHIGPTTPS